MQGLSYLQKHCSVLLIPTGKATISVLYTLKIDTYELALFKAVMF